MQRNYPIHTSSSHVLFAQILVISERPKKFRIISSSNKCLRSKRAAYVRLKISQILFSCTWAMFILLSWTAYAFIICSAARKGFLWPLRGLSIFEVAHRLYWFLFDQLPRYSTKTRLRRVRWIVVCYQCHHQNIDIRWHWRLPCVCFLWCVALLCKIYRNFSF